MAGTAVATATASATAFPTSSAVQQYGQAVTTKKTVVEKSSKSPSPSSSKSQSPSQSQSQQLPPIMSTACVGDFVDDHVTYLKNDPCGFQMIATELAFACEPVTKRASKLTWKDVNPGPALLDLGDSCYYGYKHFRHRTRGRNRSSGGSGRHGSHRFYSLMVDHDPAFLDEFLLDETSFMDHRQDESGGTGHRRRGSILRDQNSMDMEDSVKLNFLWELEKKLHKNLKSSSRRSSGGRYMNETSSPPYDGRHRSQQQQKHDRYDMNDDNSTLTSLSDSQMGTHHGDGTNRKSSPLSRQQQLQSQLKREQHRLQRHHDYRNGGAGTVDDEYSDYYRLTGPTDQVFRPKSDHHMAELGRKYGDLRIMTSSNRLSSQSAESERRQERLANGDGRGHRDDDRRRGRSTRRSVSPTRQRSKSTSSPAKNNQQQHRRRSTSNSNTGRRQSYPNPFYTEDHHGGDKNVRKTPHRWVHQPSPPGMTIDEKEHHEEIAHRKREAQAALSSIASRKTSNSSSSSYSRSYRTPNSAGSGGRGKSQSRNKTTTGYQQRYYQQQYPVTPTRETTSPSSSYNKKIRQIASAADSPRTPLDAEDLYNDAYASKKSRDLFELKHRLEKASRPPPTISDYLEETIVNKMERAHVALQELDRVRGCDSVASSLAGTYEGSSRHYHS